jgi:hypothetical protein
MLAFSSFSEESEETLSRICCCAFFSDSILSLSSASCLSFSSISLLSFSSASFYAVVQFPNLKNKVYGTLRWSTRALRQAFWRFSLAMVNGSFLALEENVN